MKKYFNITDDLAKAALAIVFVKGPNSGVGYDANDRQKGGNGYVPISLQYENYKATEAREQSIAAGDPVVDPDITNRSYKNKSVTATNRTDLESILNTKKAMKEKPVIVCMALTNPAVVAAFEPQIDGLLVTFGVQDQALADILSGTIEPSGLLPLQLPADMQTVETQKEDVPLDMKPYTDSEGHIYDFTYGMNWKGIISDGRTDRYKKQ